MDIFYDRIYPTSNFGKAFDGGMKICNFFRQAFLHRAPTFAGKTYYSPFSYENNFSGEPLSIDPIRYYETYFD